MAVTSTEINSPHQGAEGEIWPSERSSPLWRRSGFQPPEERLELPLDT